MKRYLRLAGLVLALTPLAYPYGSLLEAAETAGKSPNGVRYHGGDEIILQGFHWNVVRTAPNNWYSTLASMAPSIAADGFSAIWMPVPWRDFSSWSDASNGTSGGGEGYFWHDFNKNGRYGSENQLKQAASALNGAGVKPIYDVVPNHMNRGYPNKEINLPAGQGLWRNDCADPGNYANDCDDGDRFVGGDADLNTGHPQNLAMFQQEFANLRNNYGGAGLRFDFVRGYAGERVDSWMGQAQDDGFCVGELWKAPGEYPSWDWRNGASWQQILKDWSDRAKCTIFDFALKERMQNGSVSDWRYGLNGNPDPRWREVAVTFVDNHDTGYSPGQNGGQHHWPLPDHLLKRAYAYILASPGTPVVYWSHMYDWGYGDFIRQLIQIRRTAGIKADSAIQFHTGFSGLVATVSGSDQQLLIALDSNLSSPGQVASGNFTEALNSDNGQVRIWRTGTGSGGDGDLVSVNFRCDNGVTQPGDSVYAVGNNSQLGNWSPAAAVRLTDTSAYPTWKGSISLPAQQQVEWKCIIRNESNPTQVKTWQSGTNNSLTVSAGVSTSGSF
ncbi:glucan 1,4-alpha-maltotetraohydrolase domain-containing protein [Pseudomonas sp.]|uniref:glucan 1,4-alpha-maltotetraohydrolase domain-containing protein n=1 Tax=Pseudomonas sp. TaxID=306 RepID=UPI002CE563C6|nr:glucan 1,4-alpha-maltotetraohydrolase domain-containing protein [Pseudomonas sp.]HUE93939.1 glucan 1,4-alpha-maltotetraohydrolase domain-containing protein [Pseudomonas sp.]